MKAELGISDLEAQGYGTTSTVEPETLRKIEMQRIEAQADYMQWRTLYITSPISVARVQESRDHGLPGSAVGDFA